MSGQLSEFSRYVDEAVRRALGPADLQPGSNNSGVDMFNANHHLTQAERYTDLGRTIPPGSRLLLLRKVRRRLAEFLTVPQTEFNRSILRYLQGSSPANAAVQASAGTVIDQLEEEIAEVKRQTQEIRRLINASINASLETITDELGEGLADVKRETQEIRPLVQAVEQRSYELGQDLTGVKKQTQEIRPLVQEVLQRQESHRNAWLILNSRVEMLCRDLKKSRAGLSEDEAYQKVSTVLKEVSDEFYSELQERFRGPRDEIMERQKVYLDVVEKVSVEPSFRLLDLGCGRGEWLELLSRHGMSGYGVDTNALFVDACQKRGLDVQLADAIEHLAKLPESSLSAISAFHLVEHLNFDDLLELVDHCLRVLEPGGVVIFETPNPGNVNSGLITFNLDPTHKVPLPPMLLEFLLSKRGFVDIEIRYVNPLPSFKAPLQQQDLEGSSVSLVERVNAAFFGAQDYAVVAYKLATMV